MGYGHGGFRGSVDHMGILWGIRQVFLWAWRVGQPCVSTARRVTTWQAYTLSSTVPCMSDARSVDMIALLRCILVRSATSFVSVEAVWPLGAGRLHQIDLRRHTASQPARPAEHIALAHGVHRYFLEITAALQESILYLNAALATVWQPL